MLMQRALQLWLWFCAARLPAGRRGAVAQGPVDASAARPRAAARRAKRSAARRTGLARGQPSRLPIARLRHAATTTRKAESYATTSVHEHGFASRITPSSARRRARP